jgi:hypothetical protein
MIIVNDLDKNLELDRAALAGVSGGSYTYKEFYKKVHYKVKKHHRRPRFVFIVLKPYYPKYFKGYGCHYTPKRKDYFSSINW